MARAMYAITRSGDLFRRLRARPRLYHGAAWFFIIFSLAHLAWVISVKWADPSGLTTLYQATADGETMRAWGLAYSGVFGLLLAMAQFASVGLAAIMSVRTRRKTRRIGHGILIGWASLWAINLLYLAGFDLAVDSLAQAALMSFLLGCTIYRAACPYPARTIAATVNDNETDLQKANIQLYVDGTARGGFAYNTDTNRLTYTTPTLSYARHTVKVVAKDAAGNTTASTWGFKVVR